MATRKLMERIGLVREPEETHPLRRDPPDPGDDAVLSAKALARPELDARLPAADRRSRALPAPGLALGQAVLLPDESQARVICGGRGRDWIVCGWREVDDVTGDRRLAYGTFHRSDLRRP